MILPAEGFIGDSRGEYFIWELFRNELPGEYISFHGYDIGIRRPDIIVLVPDKGILIIENKSIKAKNIAKVPNNTMIQMLNKPPVYSPWKQAQKYFSALQDNLLIPHGINDVMVAYSVSYPYITEAEFFAKNLDKISIREVAFLKEDLENQETIVHRIEEIFARFYKDISPLGVSKGGFHLVKMDQVANLISPDYKNLRDKPEDRPEKQRQHQLHPTGTSDYSMLILSRDGSAFSDEKMPELVSLWRKGTKLFLYTGSPEAHARMLNAFDQEIKAHNLPLKEFEIKHNSSFRLETGLYPADRIEQEELVIRNGENFESSDTVLTLLDQYTSFNYGQYKMEHAPATDVKVTAGAGTGKTHTMVSRISYLVWKDDVEPDEFRHYLIMITFTNKSADEMKHRLFQYYLNMYMLTQRPEYFRYLEAVEDIQISTIHSLCKAIIGKFGTRLGLGTDFQISTGNFRRKEILREELDRWLETAQGASVRIKMKNYFLQKRLEEFIDKIDNKNVDLISAFDSLDFGKGPNCMPRSLLEVVKRTQQRLDDEMTENNNVCLKSIIRKLGQLCDLLTEADFPAERSVQYLFVDEFQDTDNVQIELIQRFQRIAGFHWFVVGDTKQCIYRFRGADDEAFGRLTKDHPCYEVALKKNYRTDISLLEEMNRDFSHWDHLGFLKYSGDEILIGVKVQPEENPLELIPCEKDPDEETLVQVIREAIARAEQVDDQAAILVRNNYQIEMILDLCRKHQISVGTEIGGRLFQSDPTIDMYKLLLALRYSNEPEYLFNLYTTSYIRGIIPKKELVGKSREDLVKFFEAHCGIPDWAEYKSEIRMQPVMYVLQKIIQKCHPWDRFVEIMDMPGKEQKLRNYYMRNLDQVFEKLVHVANTDYLTINKITDYLEIMIATKQEADERESFEELDGEERLICTTVHKAKGMEFDTVILPYNNLNITNTIDKGNVDVIFDNPQVAYRVVEKEDTAAQKSWAKTIAFENDYYQAIKQGENQSRAREETRILYVAMTRAKRKLVCMIPKSRNLAHVTWGTLIKGGLE